MPKPRHQTLSSELAERVRHVSDETLVIALEAFREGRQVGAARVGDELKGYLDQLYAEFERLFAEVDSEALARMEGDYENARPSPVAAAHFGGAGEVIERVRSRLGQLVDKARKKGDSVSKRYAP